MRTLITGGAGYIGSHVVVALAEAGHAPVVLDSMANAPEERLERLAELAGSPVPHVRADVRDTAAVAEALRQHSIDAVVHCAGLKSAPDSNSEALDYWDVNVGGTISLLKAMRETGVRRLVFSSSAAVYGDVDGTSREDLTGLVQLNPYARTKYVDEQLLRDVAAAEPGWAVAALRYFNPIGAHPSGLIGDSPKGTPGNIMPLIMQVAEGTREQLLLTGTDFPTVDGTGVRDYFHVMDLAQGHVLALEALADREGTHLWNLGSGSGASVVQLADAFERATGRQVPRVPAPRRPGDIAVSTADITRAREELGYAPTRTLEEGCADAWRFRQASRG